MSLRELRFFRNYNRTLGAAYLALLLGMSGFFAWQLDRAMDDEVRALGEHLQRHHQFLEFVLRSSADQVESLRMAAGRPAAGGRRPRATCPGRPAQLATRAALRPAAAGGWNRDLLEDRDAGGNLVGVGALGGRDPDFYCDLDAALSLDAQLRSVAFRLPHAARARFLSVQQFQLAWPWRPAHEIPFMPALYDDPVWRIAQPQRNPERLKFWGPAYFGGQDVGLLVPVAAPVYDADRFMGVVALDMSLDYLHRVHASFAWGLGTASVIDESGALLAHPGLYADPLAVLSTLHMSQLLAPDALPDFASVLALPDGVPVVRNGKLLIRRGFAAAPWHLVQVVPRSALWTKLLFERGAGMLAALAGMALLMALSWVLTSREFVLPAARLVSHLMAESGGQPQPVPRVPPAWRPWFDAITRAFRRSLELTALRRELDIAARLQQSILPRHWPSDARFTLWGTTAAAREVGGDFYDHFQLVDGRCALVVADVSGKGIGAGLFAMVAKTLLRSVGLQAQAAVGEVCGHVNTGLCADNDTSMFVTALHAHYEPASAELVYVSAGHPPALWIHAHGGCEWLASTGGTALGVVEDLAYREGRIRLAPGETLLMYTDGVTDAEDAGARAFGMQRLQALFAQRPPAGAREAVDRVRKALIDFTDGAEQFDDITCMALHCNRLGAAA
ncbi:SpoIIE family protein phosphatase [Ramlibacter sp. AN1015]|uniref:SpoIIE family protein phosphatase n=1 Tax=Ramlibacter sp. AN1015 TaxID=3133428 RepID=UPI0030C02D6F